MTFSDKIAFHWEYWRKQPAPARAVAAHVLAKAGILKWFSYRRNEVSIRFRGGGLARLLWVEPDRICEGERFLEHTLQEGDVFVDVGANIGVLTLLAARKVGRGGKVIAVEAHPRTYSALLHNLRMNKAGNVSPVNCAVGSERGSVRFSDRPDDDWNRVDPNSGAIEVEVRRLDDVCQGIEGIVVLKIDVEGFELPVLRGAPQVLRQINCLLLECWAEHTASYGYEPKDLLALVRSYGFKGYVLREAAASIVLVEMQPDHVPEGLENWVFVREVRCLERAGLEVIGS